MSFLKITKSALGNLLAKSNSAVKEKSEDVSINNSDYLQKARKYGHFTGYKN